LADAAATGDVAHTAVVRRLYAGSARTDPGPARPRHNGLAGIVRRQGRCGDRPVARMRRSTGPQSLALHRPRRRTAVR